MMQIQVQDFIYTMSLKWVLGYIIGNGWEDTTVAYTDEKYPDMEPYKGTYLTASKDASAFESLLAETGDRMLYYESTRYDEQRLISLSSGNATDPFDYPKRDCRIFPKMCPDRRRTYNCN